MRAFRVYAGIYIIAPLLIVSKCFSWQLGSIIMQANVDL